MKVNKKNNVIFTLLIISILSFLLWARITIIKDYKEYHQLIAINSVNNVSESISQFITERKRLIQVFAIENSKLIKNSVLSPEDEKIRSKLVNKVKTYFPEYFSFTVTDKFGEPYYDDFDGEIGELCLVDIKRYASKNIANPRVHPHPVIYHYDLLASLKKDNRDDIFFISFPADELSNYLRSAQAIGHKTMLVSKKFENIIEVTTDGARNKNFRQDYRLSKDELKYLLSEHPVEGTYWTVYDFQESKLFSNFISEIIWESIVIFIIFLIVGLILLYRIKKEEQRRIKAELAKSEFVAIVSHELRTPLTSIGGAIKLIESEVFGAINDQIKSYLNIASNNIDRLTNIVNDILDVKKMEAGEFVLHRENINFSDVVEQAVKENFDYANKFNVSFDFIKPDKNYIIFADKDRLLQVLSNLLSNAVKYGAKNDCIKIYFKELSKNIRLNIEDHGEGLKEENKDIVFDKFTQSHSREKEVVKGTGLGLSIVKSIIDNHGGAVSYESGENKGTIFYILLPLVR